MSDRSEAPAIAVRIAGIGDVAPRPARHLGHDYRVSSAQRAKSLMAKITPANQVRCTLACCPVERDSVASTERKLRLLMGTIVIDTRRLGVWRATQLEAECAGSLGERVHALRCVHGSTT